MSRANIRKGVRKIVYDKYNGHCAYCGCELEYKDMQVDHMEAVYRAEYNGKQADNSIDNYMPACRMCNFYKSTYTIDLFREMISGIPERLKKVFIFRLAVKYGLIEIKDKLIRFYFEGSDTDEWI